MENFIDGPLGIIHTMFGCLALFFGGLVLSREKGTKVHRYLGYLYVFSMIALNLSALPITNMTGEIGVFHFFVFVSLPTILLAIVMPIFFRRYDKWLELHFTFMYWSYIGLISAFIAEVIIRLPSLLLIQIDSPVKMTSAVGYLIVAVILLLTMGAGEYVFRRLQKKWLKLS